MCFICKQPGHLAKDCQKKEVPAAPGKGEDTIKECNKGEEKKQEEKPPICYNCGGNGHTSRQCPSESLYGRAKEAHKSSWSKPVVSKCEGKVEGQ